MSVAPITDERLAEVRERFGAIETADLDSLTGHVKGLLARLDASALSLSETREEIERLRDFGGDAVDLAGRILENLGIGQDASREPGADRRRDRIAAMIQRSLDASSLRKGAEVVAWRWRPKDGVNWVTGPYEPSNVAGHLVIEPLYALVSGSREDGA